MSIHKRKANNYRKSLLFIKFLIMTAFVAVSVNRLPGDYFVDGKEKESLLYEALNDY